MSSQTLPPGYEDENRAPGYVAYAIVFTVTTVFAIVLRFWSRRLPARDRSRATPNAHFFWWDDWVALLAAAVILAYFGMAFSMMHLGFGRHVAVLPQENLFKILKMLFGLYFVYDVALFLTKTSALLFLTRMFPRYTNPSWWNYTLWTAYGLNIAWLLGIIFGTVFQCDPIAKNWNPFLPGKCGSTSALYIGAAVPSVAIDLIILLLPMPKIWVLHISLALKSGLTIVFLLGYCVIVVSLGRLVTTLVDADKLNADITYEGMPVLYWISAEAPTTLLSICIPPMVHLGRHLASAYLVPLASSVSSFLSLNRSSGDSTTSKAGTYASGATSNNEIQDFRMRPSGSSKGQAEAVENRSVQSVESQRDLVR